MIEQSRKSVTLDQLRSMNLALDDFPSTYCETCGLIQSISDIDLIIDEYNSATGSPRYRLEIHLSCSNNHAYQIWLIRRDDKWVSEVIGPYTYMRRMGYQGGCLLGLLAPIILLIGKA